MKKLDIRLLEKAHKAAADARKIAYAPYSEFPVGAALVMKDGSIITGCNIENSSYGATVCAERTAIWRAINEGKKDFAAVVIVTGPKAYPPCALCLQVMSEFMAKDTPIYMCDPKCLGKPLSFGDFLPISFDGKEALLD